MNNDLKKLRKEAYKVWGISHREIIYDFPKFATRENYNRFRFKLDYDKYESWPKSYQLHVPTMNEEDEVITETVNRTIMPIIVHKQYGDLRFKNKVWYDMPELVHQYLLLYSEEEYPRNLKLKKWLNKILPKRFQFSEYYDFKDFVFEVIVNEGIYEVEIIP